MILHHIPRRKTDDLLSHEDLNIAQNLARSTPLSNERRENALLTDHKRTPYKRWMAPP